MQQPDVSSWNSEAMRGMTVLFMDTYRAWEECTDSDHLPEELLYKKGNSLEFALLCTKSD